MDIKMKIFRFDPKQDKEPRYEIFNVPYEEKMRVLHAIQYIQDNFDGSLAIRWNCRAGRCGSCAAEVNGRPVLTCKYEIMPDTKEVVVEPLKVFPVVKDLVVDVSEMWERTKMIPPFSPKQTSEPWKIFQEDIELAKEMRKCIECFICQDVCHVIREHQKNYLGPRFVVKAASFDYHPMDSETREEIMKEQGMHFCNVTRCCQEACPEHIQITDNSIIPMKEKIVDSNYSVTAEIKKILRRLKSK